MNKAKQNIVFILLLLGLNSLIGQTNNFWTNYLGKGFRFDSLGNIVLQDINSVFPDCQNTSSICDNTGKPLIYSDGFNIYNNKNEVIENGSGLYSNFIYRTNNYILQLDTSCFLVYGQRCDLNSNVNSLYFSFIFKDNQIKTGFKIPNKLKNIEIKVTDFKCIGFTRNIVGNVLMILRDFDYFFSYQINSNGIIQKLDSFYYPQRNLYNDTVFYNPDLKIGGIASIMKISNKGNLIAFTDRYLVTTKLKNQDYLRYCTLNLMELDKNTGKFFNLSNLSKEVSIANPFDGILYNYLSKMCFSLNDSFVYAYDIYNLDKLNAPKIREENIIQFDIFNKTKAYLFNVKSPKNQISDYNGMSLNHLGQLYFYSINNNNELCINYIPLPNSAYPNCGPVKNKYTFEKNNNFKYASWPEHIFDFIRIKKDIIYNCSAIVKLKNSCLKEINFNKFIWHVTDENGVELIFNQVEPPEIKYHKNGSYSVKLFASTVEHGGYGEWYSDSIRVNIPLKPIPNFSVKDSLVCRYSAALFINNSTSKNSLSNSYTWHFGDDSTSSEKNPSHVFNKAGTYSISLNYSNGYCDSTLVKNQYIRVVDAPKPGFEVINERGCSPMISYFRDTTTLNVKQKDYFFSDSNKWQNIEIATMSFSHKFEKPGVHRVVQRLIGYSGCVIQRDSFNVFVTKGLKTNDTLHVLNSTVINSNALIYWNKYDGAVSYQLYKDGIIYINTKDTFYFENISYTSDKKYTIAGIDSCGNLTTTGREGKPILLDVNLSGLNEASIISFSPYSGWKGKNINYKIQKRINGVWSDINIQSQNIPYIDDHFLIRDSLFVCYRIEAFEKENSNLISHSNEVCIPYTPVIFLPNSFSPNYDGLNDYFEPICFGIKSYSLTVLNRWGEIIFKGLENEKWNGYGANEGIYTIIIRYITNQNIELQQQINVTLLK